MSKIVRLICPNLRCRAVLTVPGIARGRTIRCRQCGTRIQVPRDKPAAPQAATPTEDESK